MTRGGQVTAVLGPTNTGKTHLAVERMLASPTGMIGLPLRLLAREVYDRVKARAGDAAVALVTGEEKIIPAKPRFWVSTVEAMPDIDVSFLAIDEVQLAADFERGHVFTDRILSRRGRDETLLLGAATMRGALEDLVPGLNFVARPRFSRLTWAGQRKITRLPRRSAIVAFSAETVYALAELVRRQRGGAAVVLGALSPRTRNAQVALYQSGDVDYLVATDAIGMGLNMDVDHVAFAATRKFDGFQYRNLTPAELGQVAGRAGRFLQDGTFGVTGEAEAFDQSTIERLESHHFDPVRVLQWRNSQLDFSSLEALKAALNQFPTHPRLTRAQGSADVTALDYVSRDDEVTRLAASRQAVERLWEVCQVPDYRNISAAEHAGIVSRIFGFLLGPSGRIPPDWFERQLGHCNHSDGNIDTLSNRIAHIRTWTFVANRADWLDDPLCWQACAREIEDRLSDALHQQLTRRFIDRRTSILMRRLRQKEDIMSSVEDDGTITVEGECVGRMVGLTFVSQVPPHDEAKTLKAAALKVVDQELVNRAQSIAASPDPDLIVTREGDIVWQSAAIGRLMAGPAPLKPRVQLKADAQLCGPDREAVQARLEKFAQRHVAGLLEPLVGLSEAEDMQGITRGIAFRLIESMGIIDRADIAAELKDLAQDERAKLRRHGVRFGSFHLFIPALLKPGASELRVLLWSLARGTKDTAALDPLPPLPGQGLTSVTMDRDVPAAFYLTAGYRPCGRRAVRIDMLERLADMVRERTFWKSANPEAVRPEGSIEGGGFSVIPDMMSLVGCSGEDFAEILKSLGFALERRQLPPEALAPAPHEPPAAAVSGASASPGDDVPAQPPKVKLAGEAASITSRPSALALPETAPAAVALTVPAAGASGSRILEVWWPRDTGPFRRREPGRNTRHAKPRQPAVKAAPGRNEARAPRGRGKDREKDKDKRRPPHKAPERQPVKEREPRIDKDSPFAVLGQLRSELVARSKRGT
jgi:ATP-dependent RNA helicase SUPV3L1/SUV3